MNQKQNCWEYMSCGREPGGKHVDHLGVCPAAAGAGFDGINGGQNAGRFCWYIAGTLCSGKVQGTFARKFEDCLKCPFLREVLRDEGESLIFMALGDHFFRMGDSFINPP
jgi:hypothetical protein